MFEAETAKEEAIVSVLRNGPATAIYTVGLEGADGEPKRVKGPAYLAPQGPKAITIYGVGATVASVEATKKKLARTAMSLKDGSSAVIDGWRFVSYDVKADGKDCLKCHRSAEYPMANKQAAKLKVGDTIGRFLIATKEPSQVR
ncbi:hypothetical protein EON81_19065 [bacterium]|nr:MAG: hypothetical protein EON81_19065 [bacterium]